MKPILSAIVLVLSIATCSAGATTQYISDRLAEIETAFRANPDSVAKVEDLAAMDIKDWSLRPQNAMTDYLISTAAAPGYGSGMPGRLGGSLHQWEIVYDEEYEVTTGSFVAGYTLPAVYEMGFIAIYKVRGGFWPGEFQNFELFVFDQQGNLLRHSAIPQDTQNSIAAH